MTTPADADHALTSAQAALLDDEQRMLGRVHIARPALLEGARPPYHAHLRVAIEGQGERDVLLGAAPLVVDAGVAIVDAGSSPFAVLFFRAAPGELFEQEIQGQVVCGRVLQKRLVEIAGGELVCVEGEGVRLERLGGRWRPMPRPAPLLSAARVARTPRDREPARLPAARVASLFDERQRAVLAHAASVPLLVTGGAGSGKTTVGLHRMARLRHSDPARWPERDLLVVVPEAGLAALATEILGDLHLHDVEVRAFEDWIAREARRTFPDLPTRHSDEVSAAVSAFKRHPAVRAVLPVLVARLGDEMAERLDRRLAARGRVRALWRDLRERTPLARLDALAREVLAATPPSLQAETQSELARERGRLFQVRADVLELFGDRALLARIVEASHGELTAGMAAEVLEHTRVQLSETSEETYAHVDPEARRTIDGLGLDAGTPDEDAGTIDGEDYAVCFELLALKTGALSTPQSAPRVRAAVLVDEAQELAPLELAAVGRLLAPGGALAVSGDSAQQVDPAARFAGWDAALAALGAPSYTRHHLLTSYRCPEPVLRFARAVLGPGAVDEEARAARGGAPVARSLVPSDVHAAVLVAQGLAHLLAREPSARVAVICRGARDARLLHARLPPQLHARLALDGAVAFAPGVAVTTVAQVKGLESDVVVVPDAGPDTYGGDASSRHALYVACTRAIAQLWVVSPGAPAPPLDGAT